MVSPRVLHLSASFPRSASDAVAPFLLDLVAAQRDLGWDARAVGLHDAGLPGRQVVGDVPVRRVRYAPDRHEVLAYRGGGHATLQRRWHVLLLPGLVASLWAASFAEVLGFRPQVVHAHWLLPNAFVAALVPGRHRLVITLHGNDVTLARHRLVNPLARFAARRADVVLAVSEPLAREAEQVLGLPHDSIIVARLPLARGLEPAPLPLGRPLRLLTAGRASTEKGFDVLVEALRRPEAASWSATVVTDGPERERLERLAAPLGDRLRIRSLVPRAELFALVRDHHAVVVPSRAEGLGLFAVEALALGRLVIASDVGGLSEVVEPEEDGALVPPDDPDALATALADLATPGRLRPPVARAVARHRPDVVAAAHRAAYFER